jgi:hypothetical protein
LPQQVKEEGINTMAPSFPTPKFVTGGCVCNSLRYRVDFPTDHDFEKSVSFPSVISRPIITPSTDHNCDLLANPHLRLTVRHLPMHTMPQTVRLALLRVPRHQARQQVLQVHVADYHAEDIPRQPRG